MLHWLWLGKTRTALNLIDAFVTKNEKVQVLVVVPTQFLKDQWITQVDERGLSFNVRVEIINTVIKYNWTCDLLIVDRYLFTLNLVNCGKILRAFTTKYK